jgi:AsmA-like C-terminal region
MVDSKELKPGFWRRPRRLKWALGISAAGLAAFIVGLLILAHHAEPLLRARILQALEDHFHAHVELGSFHITLRNGLWAEGKGLRIWQPVEATGRDVGSSNGASPQIGKPIVQLEAFRFHAPLEYDPAKPFRISVVELSGLYVDVPPHHKFEHGLPTATGSAKDANAGETANNENGSTLSSSATNRLLSFMVESLDCHNAQLTMETDKPGKLPMVFSISHLTVSGIQADKPFAFRAELINPRPTGIIHAHGNIGPWDVSDPGATPLNGDYLFEQANLGDFKGVAGILSSNGHYSGTLRNITVDGQTDTPEFRLDRFETPVHLSTRFHALVDGTDGDTQLEPVNAVLDQSHFQVRGQVVRATAVQNGGLVSLGHDIQLTMDIEDGQLDDFMKLVTHTGVPFLTGSLTLKGKLEIPPGTADVKDHLKLDGTFSLNEVRFTSSKVQDRVSELSQRGQGNPGDAQTANSASVRSTMKGYFHMDNGVVALPALEYTVPGAVINLKGTYGIDNGALDFAGTARMQATVSQMVGGWKGLLLKPVDPFFKKDGAGALVPIHVKGTRDNPDFGVDLDRLKSTAPQPPDEPH